jgi:glutathione S-transferase
MIDLYTAPTPNGHKASVTLEELGLAYETRAIDLVEDESGAAKFAENARRSLQR